MSVGERNKQKNAYRQQSLSSHCTHAHDLELTFAGLQAFKPPVIHVSVADTSAVLIPSTTWSTATDSARFLERAALWAHHRIADGGDDKRRADWPDFWRVREETSVS